MVKVLFGVCSFCQSSHPLVTRDRRQSGLLVQELEGGTLAVSSPFFDGIFVLDAPELVMGPHNFDDVFSVRCDGEGTTPQATFAKELIDEEFFEHKSFLEEPSDDSVGYAGEGDWDRPDPTNNEFDGFVVYDPELQRAVLKGVISIDMADALMDMDSSEGYRVFRGRVAKPNRCRYQGVAAY